MCVFPAESVARCKWESEAPRAVSILNSEIVEKLIILLTSLIIPSKALFDVCCKVFVYVYLSRRIRGAM